MSSRLMYASIAIITALAAAPAIAQQDQHHPGTAAGSADTPPSSTPKGMRSGAMGRSRRHADDGHDADR
jgi:hypothetical protein